MFALHLNVLSIHFDIGLALINANDIMVRVKLVQASLGKPNLRATHTAEIPYVFNNLKAVRVFPDGSSPELTSASETERKLADIVSSYWVNFARTGNPNGKGLAPWPAYRDKTTGRAMILGDTLQAMDENTTDTAKWDLYDQLYAKQQPAK